MIGAPPQATMLPDEIQALLVTLRQAEDRLHELTAGQVDAITDGEGRTFMLQRAQEEVRRVDAARRTAILNSLPANIALLDASGFIVATNESWRQSGRDDGPYGLSADVGGNYGRLPACPGQPFRGCHLDCRRPGIGAGAGRAPLRHRIRPDLGNRPTLVQHDGDALSEASPAAWSSCTWTSPTQALRAGAGGQRGAAARVRRQLRQERARLLEAQRVAKIGSWETDLATMSGVWSDETFRIHEMEPRPGMTYAAFLEKVHPDDRARVDADLQASLSSAEPAESRHRLVLPGGRIKILEERWQVVFDESGTAVRVSGTCQDITDRRLDEERIERLNRGYVVLSQINALIGGCRDRDELFQDACRSLWRPGFCAGLDRQGRPGRRQHRARRLGGSCADPTLRSAGVSLHDETRPCVLAVRSRQAVIVNNVAGDSPFSAPGNADHRHPLPGLPADHRRRRGGRGIRPARRDVGLFR